MKTDNTTPMKQRKEQIMEWISVKEKLPKKYKEVLVWMKYKDYTRYHWNTSWLEGEPDSPHDYVEPISGKCWAMGSAKDYRISHWSYVKRPSKL